jgi:hypothetical protein
VLEEPHHAAGSQDTSQFGQCGEHITKHSPAASTLASGSGNDSARPARTLTGSVAARAAWTARPRRWGSGSTATTLRTPAG